MLIGQLFLLEYEEKMFLWREILIKIGRSKFKACGTLSLSLIFFDRKTVFLLALLLTSMFKENREER